MIKAAIVGDPNKVPKAILDKLPLIRGACQISMARLVMRLTKKIMQEKLSGQVLKNRTGTLRRSIHPNVYNDGDVTIGTVGTNIEYASIHEFGGKTRPHLIAAKNGKALRWLNPGFVGPLRMTKKGKMMKKQSAGAWMFASVVHHPGSNMPERSFMRTALEEMRPDIVKEFWGSIMQVIRS